MLPREVEMRALLGWILGQKRAVSRIKTKKNREKSTRILDRFVDDKRVTAIFVLFKAKNHCFDYFGDCRAHKVNGFEPNSRRKSSVK